MRITEWIEDSIFLLPVIATPADEELDFAMLAGVLRAEAQYAGFSVEALETACSGDISWRMRMLSMWMEDKEEHEHRR
ncbi:hypothetical protein GCM10010924_41560 [Rhizobium wenxiniae]|uniref:Uncharacterized protein n=1 Tax=Rhizobium wenxiniae TaxID=1737357 RepID=A0A7W9Y7M2_9HYPH|nr:hypothetical protein [Rhizobium wenxiniae]MBB6163486.1 hypothetical protein [Rhizobium wenxiniae]GGG08345.1 hypothetical protein GCM10010924_41560 [Rhizobium wenxiniae]